MSSRPEDRHVGKRIRNRRLALGLTQAVVAKRLGISFQQLQKYETGANGVRASRMMDIANALNTTPAYFFEGLGGGAAAEATATSADEEILLMGYRKLIPAAQIAVRDIVVAAQA